MTSDPDSKMTRGDHQVSEDDDFYRWNRLENLESVGRRFLVKWSRAVELQAERVLDPSRPFDDREVDAWQFCTAARQVSQPRRCSPASTAPLMAYAQPSPGSWARART